MPFFIGSVKQTYGCTSRVFLDGECLSSALLIKERTEAEIQIYPCPRQHSLEQSMSLIEETKCLKLHVLLSDENRFELSLFKDNLKISSSSQDLPSLTLSRKADPLQNGNAPCRMFLFIGNQLIKISLHTASGFARDVFMQPPQYSHPEYLHRSMKDRDERSGVLGDGLFVDNVPGGCNEQRIWMNQDFHASSSALTTFDDCKPISVGLCGAFHWDGMRSGQIITVTKLKFWLSETYIVGFQATYTVDGLRTLGPRNGLANLPRRFRTRVFEMVDEESISCIYALSGICGYLVRLFIVTDRGRSFALATASPVVSERSKLVLRHPNAKLVGFRGSFKTGLISFGITCELDQQIAERMPEGLVCCICGAHSAYFANMHLFRVHAHYCVEDFMKSCPQPLLPYDAYSNR